MVEEVKGGQTAEVVVLAAAAAPVVDDDVDGADDQFFIDEEQFADVIPEFGTCGGGDDTAETSNAVAVTGEGHMCSQGENCCKNKDSDTQKAREVVVVPEVPVIKNPCYKCKEKSAQYKNKQDMICKECLFWMLTHRFKNALVRYVRIQKDFPNLVAISGGSNSMAMLHFLYCCLNGNTSLKKMFFKIHILYIDEARGVYGATQEEADARITLVTETCQRYGFDYTILPIEKIFELQRDSLNEAPEDMDQPKYKTFS